MKARDHLKRVRTLSSLVPRIDFDSSGLDFDCSDVDVEGEGLPPGDGFDDGDEPDASFTDALLLAARVVEGLRGDATDGSSGTVPSLFASSPASGSENKFVSSSMSSLTSASSCKNKKKFIYLASFVTWISPRVHVITEFVVVAKG